MNIDALLSKFANVRRIKNNHWMAVCPCHDDKKGSLSISNTNDRVLIYCFGGCNINDILKASGLTFADLFYDSGKEPMAIYQYRNADGSLSHEKLKYKNPEGKTFKQRRIDENGDITDNLDGTKRIPYNLPELLNAIKTNSPVIYVEGEKDADTARYILGYNSTTLGGASDWKDEYKHYFKDANLIIVPDKDDPGFKLSEKMAKDLSDIAKSLKVIILPEGKDLTEWVEKGNNNLKSLIESSNDLAKYKGLSQPIAKKTLSGFQFYWHDLSLTIKIDHLTSELECIITILDNDRKIHASKINLLAQRTLSTLATRLDKTKKLTIQKWEEILSQIVLYCQDATSAGGAIENINTEAVTMKTEYLLDPILPLNQPVTLYTAGGKGKSTFADYFAILVQFGIAAQNELPFIPTQANVLYLDWESDKETHRKYITAIKRGLGVTNTEEIRYIRCEYPLTQIVDDIREKIFLFNIGFVVIDSQMAATASGTRGLTEAQVASEFYNMIRSFNCTTLTIDHITKQSMNLNSGTETPYGSVVKYNRSRSQFELRLPDEDDNLDHKEYALVHRKYNLGKKIKPLGIAVDFTNNDNELLSIKFSSCEISENESLSRVLPLWQRLKNILTSDSPLSVKELAGRTTAEEQSIRAELSRTIDKMTGQKMFTKVSKDTEGKDTWGLCY